MFTVGDRELFSILFQSVVPVTLSSKTLCPVKTFHLFQIEICFI